MPRKLVLLFAALAPAPTLWTAWTIWRVWPGSLVTRNHATVVQDYLVMWVSGRMAGAGDVAGLATFGGFNAGIAGLLGAGIDSYWWLYAPHMLVLSTPLAVLPVVPSFLCWTVLTVGLLWWVMARAGVPALARVAVVVSPAALESVFDGQNGALLAAAIVGSLVFRRAWIAGLFLAVLTLKPQLAVVVPLCLLASRRWGVIGWGVAWTGAWVGVSVLAFGAGPWVDYMTSIMPQARALHLGSDAVPFGSLYLHDLVVTPFALFRAWGAGAAAAQVGQGCVTLVMLGLAWRLWAAGGVDARLRLAFTLAAVPLATPYAMTYDMIAPSLACALVVWAGPRSGMTWAAAAAAWFWPGFAVYAGARFEMPGLGAVVYALLALAIWREWRGARTTAVDIPPRYSSAGGMSVLAKSRPLNNSL